MMSDAPTIKCKKCSKTFQPDMKTRGAWLCSACQAKNPNLKRHYRSVADICILGFIFTAIVVAVEISRAGLNLGVLLAAGHAVVLLVTIVFVYKSKTPWTDGIAKALIWTVSGLVLLFNVIVPLVFTRALSIPAIVFCALLFPYLFWLNSQTGKCTASGASLLPEKEEL